MLVREGSFELLFLSELEGGAWIATGLADDLGGWIEQARERLATGAGVALQARDEALASLLEAHRQSLAATDARPVAPPSGLPEATARFARFLTAALGA